MHLRNSEKAALLQLKKYLTDHYDEKITLKDLSDRFWPDRRNGEIILFSATRLHLAFKTTFFCTIHEYQKMVRMERGKYLLGVSDLSIKAIALSLGYSRSNKFTRIFKKHFGITPTAYREKMAPHTDQESQA